MKGWSYISKIGIITLNEYVNYGNRLHNLALQETFKTYDYKIETVWIKEENPNNNSNLFKKAIRIIMKPFSIFKNNNNIRYLVFHNHMWAGKSWSRSNRYLNLIELFL